MKEKAIFFKQITPEKVVELYRTKWVSSCPVRSPSRCTPANRATRTF